MSKERRSERDSTLAALLREKPKRGRPPREISRQSVYVELTRAQKERVSYLGERLPEPFARADVADVAIMVLAARLESLRRAVSGRTREIPEGITDLESLYLLWDLSLIDPDGDARWTSIRVSPQQAIELGRAHGTLNVLFGASRSDVFVLALALLGQFVDQELEAAPGDSLTAMSEVIADVYL